MKEKTKFFWMGWLSAVTGWVISELIWHLWLINYFV